MRHIVLGLLKDKPIAYHSDLSKSLNSVTAGLFLSQLLFWNNLSEDGWIYRTQEQFFNETGLSRREQETARKKLRDVGILEEKYKGVPRKLYYKINEDKLLEILNSYYQQEQKNPISHCQSHNGGIRHYIMSESANKECTKPPYKSGGIRQTSMAESDILYIENNKRINNRINNTTTAPNDNESFDAEEIKANCKDFSLEISKSDKKSESSIRRRKEIKFIYEDEEWENISEKDIENWKKAYPACDIEVELERMKQWLLANPNKRKKNYRRFIVNWLSRQQDRGGTIRNSGEKCSSVEDILKALEEVE
jgi:hypothetical protein